MTSNIDDKQKDFQRDGFVAYPQFVHGTELKVIHHELGRFMRETLPKVSSDHLFYEVKGNPNTLKQIQQLGDHDFWFDQLARVGRFRETAEELLGGPVVSKNIQYFNKPPKLGQATPPHQDGFYFMISPCEAVTMWFALEDVDEETGCVRYIPGSHRGAMCKHDRTRTLGFSQGITDYWESGLAEREVAIPAKAGDLLVHHAKTIHRADSNQSESRTRRALGFIYYRADVIEDSEAHHAYQERLRRELVADGKL